MGLFGWITRPMWAGYFIQAFGLSHCPGCGRDKREHGYGCPVLVRLTAQLLCQEDELWRERAYALSQEWPAHSEEARHFRAVAEEPEPDPKLREPGAYTPKLAPCTGGYVEAEPDECRYNYPSGLTVDIAAFHLHFPEAESLPFLFCTREELANVRKHSDAYPKPDPSSSGPVDPAVRSLRTLADRHEESGGSAES